MVATTASLETAVPCADGNNGRSRFGMPASSWRSGKSARSVARWAHRACAGHTFAKAPDPQQHPC
eukprot:2419948-Pyramimonas_sp.AAC.1